MNAGRWYSGVYITFICGQGVDKYKLNICVQIIGILKYLYSIWQKN